MHAEPKSKRFIQSVSPVLQDASADDLYRLFNQIALVRYHEGKDIGYLALCPVHCGALIGLDAPMPLNDARGVRKMLQMTSSTLAALCDGRVVYGFSHPSADLLIVQFQWPGIWRLTKDGRTIMRTEIQTELEDLGALREDCFYEALQLVFGPLPQANEKLLWNLMLSATRQRSGTNVLISANAAAEAARLNTQCTKLKPFELIPPIMEQITSIDGTVVIDPSGQCHAVGAILDGGPSSRGVRARGGRYNSALMYVDSSPFPSMILVVSKDGMIDLVFRQPSQPRS